MLGMFAASASVALPPQQDFTANDSFVATSTEAWIWGWGGGGGGGARRLSQNGGNGAAASYSLIHVTGLTIGRTYNVVVGTAGPAGATGLNAGTPSADGTASQVVDSVTATVVWQAGGGRRGVGGATGVPGAGGGIGQSSDSIGDDIRVGPAGNSNAGAAVNAPTGDLAYTPSTGGTGGAAGAPGNAGNAPGGPGGAGSTSGTGQNGAAGARGEVHVQQAA